jgi:hypothetical protein
VCWWDISEGNVLLVIVWVLVFSLHEIFRTRFVSEWFVRNDRLLTNRSDVVDTTTVGFCFFNRAFR